MKRGMPSGAQTPDGIIFLLALIFSKAPPRYPPHHGAHWAYTTVEAVFTFTLFAVSINQLSLETFTPLPTLATPAIISTPPSPSINTPLALCSMLASIYQPNRRPIIYSLTYCKSSYCKEWHYFFIYFGIIDFLIMKKMNNTTPKNMVAKVYFIQVDDHDEYVGGSSNSGIEKIYMQ